MTSGTVTPGGVETDIVATTAGASSGYLECAVDVSNMQAGDTVILNTYRMMSGTWRLAHSITLSGVQTSKVLDVAHFYVNGAMRGRVSIQQTAGTNRSFYWEAEVAG